MVIVMAEGHRVIDFGLNISTFKVSNCEGLKLRITLKLSFIGSELRTDNNNFVLQSIKYPIHFVESTICISCSYFLKNSDDGNVTDKHMF